MVFLFSFIELSYVCSRNLVMWFWWLFIEILAICGYKYNF